MLRRLSIYLIFLITAQEFLSAQEIITGLQSNPFVSETKTNREAAKGTAAGSLALPFFDDFSGNIILPAEYLWEDEFVFINNTYSDRQITSGVATFDAIDDNGRLYESASSIVFEADKLTSMPINLNYPPADSIRLSFYYECGGIGDLPEENDSLTLQFYAPSEGKWHSIWKAEGGKRSDFRGEMIKIADPRFLKDGFRFRFINYASLTANLTEPSMAGNCDQWNIDYILLDRNRKNSDTVNHDVAFRKPHRSLLRTYESIPWKQFNQIFLQEMGAAIPMHYRNNDTIVRNVTRNFEIWDVYRNSLAKLLTAGATNINPLTNIDADADLIYTFDTDDGDSALFRITSWLITDNFDPKGNDTLVYYQRFSNYFAFDDGSSEGGYGINGLGSRNAMVAYRFKSFLDDTLRAIKICFNDSYQNANQRLFDLMVWDDDGGVPGDVLYLQEKVMVQQGEVINGYYTYHLRSEVPVDDIFYVGWKQRTETFLNAGFDINTPHNGRQLFWINGNWTESQVSGSLMIRPVTGKAITTAVDDINETGKGRFTVYPNPSSDFISVTTKDIPEEEQLEISISDLNGREILRSELTGIINISSLKAGIYIAVIISNNRPISFSRFIKIR